MIELKKVTKSYGAQKVLDDITVTLERGRVHGFVGRNGSGKTILMKCIAGLARPDSGEVLVDGQLITKPRQKTALILQDFGLLPWKTVLANAELGLKVRGVDREQREAKAREALGLVGLADFAHAYPGELSGGMQQRLALARSIALDVDLLLMDEPLSALDALLREQLQDTLLELWHKEGYAQLLVTHSIDEAVYLGQRIVVLSARPGHVVGVLDNPAMGQAAYRGSSAYYELCNEIRALLRDASHVNEDEEACHA